MEKPNHIEQYIWDGLNEAGRFYLSQYGARLAKRNETSYDTQQNLAIQIV